MASLTPDEGLEWFADRGTDEGGTSAEKIYSIAVGSGSASLSANDTQLDVEEYRATKADSNVSITETSNTAEIQCRITISGGTEVPAGTDLTEFGVFARDPSIADGNVTDSDDVLVYRELRPAITMESGSRNTFEILLTVVNN